MVLEIPTLRRDLCQVSATKPLMANAIKHKVESTNSDSRTMTGFVVDWTTLCTIRSPV
jgi:hypothetical protein